MKAFGIIMSLLLIIFGAVFPVPEKQVDTISYCYDKSWFYKYGEEYVNGDAYNYQIEASLKAGWMSGVLTMKSISVATGILLFFITIYADKKHKELEKQTKLLEQLAGNQAEATNSNPNGDLQKQSPPEDASEQ
ncbi:MAG: hypothetical protein ACI4KR_13545 [Ruminiclostridium sp.]